MNSPGYWIALGKDSVVLANPNRRVPRLNHVRVDYAGLVPHVLRTFLEIFAAK